MSKSTLAENSKIMMSDTPEKAAKKIMSATTDSFAKVKYDMSNQPGVSNLLVMESLITGEPLSKISKQWEGETRYGELKKVVAKTVSEFLQDFQDNLAKISDEQVYKLLESGENYANEVANKKLLEVQKVVGLR